MYRAWREASLHLSSSPWCIHISSSLSHGSHAHTLRTLDRYRAHELRLQLFHMWTSLQWHQLISSPTCCNRLQSLRHFTAAITTPSQRHHRSQDDSNSDQHHDDDGSSRVDAFAAFVTTMTQLTSLHIIRYDTPSSHGEPFWPGMTRVCNRMITTATLPRRLTSLTLERVSLAAFTGMPTKMMLPSLTELAIKCDSWSNWRAFHDLVHATPSVTKVHSFTSLCCVSVCAFVCNICYMYR